MKSRLLVWPLLGLLLAGLVLQSFRLRGRLVASKLINQVEAIAMAAAGAGPGAIERVLPYGLAALRRAGEADPVAVEVPLSRGSLFLLARRPEEAIAAYRRAAALEPHPEIYLHLGDALLAAGQLEEARRNYRIALLLDPWLRSSVPAGVL
ncbi:MAG TPA: tetratricopeptide repeat protein [Thermoanaerobaculia bacterium]|nr:tetratricopeptide repeat protein [Thermoanaerobaculia bacterium]